MLTSVLRALIKKTKKEIIDEFDETNVHFQNFNVISA